MRLARCEVDAVAGPEHASGAADPNGHLAIEDDPHFAMFVRVLLVRGVRIVTPLGDIEPLRPKFVYPCLSGHRAKIAAMSRVRPALAPLLAAQQKALKEWAVVCRAIEQGRQSVLLRKGGIIEETRDFALVEPTFLLFPTFEHQEEGSVQPEYRAWFGETLSDRPSADVVRISSWARVTDVLLTHDLDALLRLAGMYAWSAEYIRMRMAYKPRKPMNVVVVRAWKLSTPIDVPVLEHFAGCKSWVPLDVAVPLDGSVPVLEGAEHAQRVEVIASILGTTAERVPVDQQP